MLLAISGICPHEDPNKYVGELKKLANVVANVEEAERLCRIFRALAIQ